VEENVISVGSLEKKFGREFGGNVHLFPAPL
jgi:hypothetical protein